MYLFKLNWYPVISTGSQYWFLSTHREGAPYLFVVLFRLVYSTNVPTVDILYNISDSLLFIAFRVRIEL